MRIATGHEDTPQLQKGRAPTPTGTRKEGWSPVGAGPLKQAAEWHGCAGPGRPIVGLSHRIGVRNQSPRMIFFYQNWVLARHSSTN
jgi:hypothetical protein